MRSFTFLGKKTRSGLYFLFGTESEAIFNSIAIATVFKNGKIVLKNAKFVGKRKSVNHFYIKKKNNAKF